MVQGRCFTIGNCSMHGKCGPAPTWKSQWGVRFGRQDPCPQTGSPMGNQACIVPRLLWDLLLLKSPHPEIQHTLRPSQKALGVIYAYLGWCAHSNQVGVLTTTVAGSPGSLFLGAKWWGSCGIHVLWLRWDKFTWTTKSCGGKGTAQPLSQEESTSEHLGHSLKRRAPRPLLWRAFIAFLSTLHWGWSSVTMHRFALGGYRKQRRGCC